MARTTKSRVGKKRAIRRAYDKAETKVMAAVGRRALRVGKRRAKEVARKAAKAALIAGSLAAAKVVLDEVRQQRKQPQA